MTNREIEDRELLDNIVAAQPIDALRWEEGYVEFAGDPVDEEELDFLRSEGRIVGDLIGWGPYIAVASVQSPIADDVMLYYAVEVGVEGQIR